MIGQKGHKDDLKETEWVGWLVGWSGVMFCSEMG